jgi:hypothetical protein
VRTQESLGEKRRGVIHASTAHACTHLAALARQQQHLNETTRHATVRACECIQRRTHACTHKHAHPNTLHSHVDDVLRPTRQRDESEHTAMRATRDMMCAWCVAHTSSVHTHYRLTQLAARASRTTKCVAETCRTVSVCVRVITAYARMHTDARKHRSHLVERVGHVRSERPIDQVVQRIPVPLCGVSTRGQCVCAYKPSRAHVRTHARTCSPERACDRIVHGTSARRARRCAVV